MLKKIYKSIEKLYPEMVELRRHFHQYPEISYKEYKTAQYIVDYYEKIDIPYEKNVGGNGVIATLKGGKPGKTVALRADFDALPIQDEKEVPYKSKVPGVMHACGHDGHTATLLTLAKVMKTYQAELEGTIVFLHQHAEEVTPSGAKPIIETGKLDHIDAIFGTHLWATVPLGVLQTARKSFMAGEDCFTITIEGQGGHGAYPHETKDAIVIGGQLITQLQEIVSRRISPLKPAVVSVGVFEGGSSFNIIAGRSKLVGTVRYFELEVQDQIVREMERILKGVCEASSASYTLQYDKGSPPVINHEEEALQVMEAVKKIDEIHLAQEVDPLMVGEDFACYLLEKPGAFFFTGAQKEGQNYPHHHPKFDIDERALPIAAKTLIGAYFAYQEENNNIYNLNKLYIREDSFNLN